MDRKYRYVFGPAISRRLGRSLGVDVVPYKTCTYDCIYCQLGDTTRRTVERAEYVPLEDLLAEVRRRFDEGVETDYVTIVGSGEPTLYSRLGELISGIKAICDVPVVVITNGSLLWREDVQGDLLAADIVVPSLDAGDPETFARVNRPDSAIDFAMMTRGLKEFRRRFSGQVWLEVFLLAGITSNEEAVASLGDHIMEIEPDRIQLNTVARPAPDHEVYPVPKSEMERLARLLGAGAEVIARFELPSGGAPREVDESEVLGLIERHPCSIDDLTHGLGLSEDEARGHVRRLVTQGAVVTQTRDNVEFYVALRDEGTQH